MDKFAPSEWLFYAESDLEAAKLLLQNFDKWHISIYHSHQSIEKIIKRWLIIKEIEFPFTHDLMILASKTNNSSFITEDLLRKISDLMEFYNNTRYPKADRLTKNDAEQSLEIAEELFKLFK